MSLGLEIAIEASNFEEIVEEDAIDETQTNGILAILLFVRYVLVWIR